MPIVNDWPFTVQGRFKSGPPDGEEVKVLLEYVIIHLSPSGDRNDESRVDVWVLRQLADVNGAELCLEVPAKELVSTFHGISTTKKVITRSQAPVGTFHTHLRAEVTLRDVSFQVYSTELYVCGARNFRRISQPQG